MAKNAHLTFDERQTIEVSLRDNLKFKEIGEIIGKDPSTISKEVRNHYKIVEKSTYNPSTRGLARNAGVMYATFLSYFVHFAFTV